MFPIGNFSTETSAWYIAGSREAILLIESHDRNHVKFVSA